MAKTCFVIMSIGDQEFGTHKITSGELKARYTDLIREALSVADPSLEITRADEVSAPGMISGDIITRIMHADFVVADVTYPNPNVFYELGLRHACRVGTIIIRERNAPRIPFDISHLRHIEYDNTPSGLKQLSNNFKECFGHFARNPTSTDNQFQDYAKLMKYRFPDYCDPNDAVPPDAVAMMALLQSPEVMDLAIRKGRGEEIDQMDLLKSMANNPNLAGAIAIFMSKTGQLNLSGQNKNSGSKSPTPNRSQRRKTRK